jgi:hypothetical protein
VVLTTRVDNVCHRLFGHGANGGMKSFGPFPRPARIDQNGARLCHDEPEGRVVRQVLRAALLLFADDGPDTFRNRLDLETLSEGKTGNDHGRG